MALSNNFKTTNNQLHLEKGVISLEFFLNSGENVDFRIDTDLFPIVIYDHTENMAKF